jgi:hypothetical protein
MFESFKEYGEAREGEAPAIWVSNGPGVSDDGRERNGRTSRHRATDTGVKQEIKKYLQRDQT